MKAFCAALVLLAAAPAHATLIQIDAVGVPPSPSFWTLGGPPPDEVSISVILDTAGTSNLQPFTGSNGIECLGHYDAQLSGHIVDVSADGTSIASGLAGAGSLVGDFPSANCRADQQSFFAGFSIDAGPYDVLFSYDSEHLLSFANLMASADPLATLLLSTGIRGGGFFRFTTPDGVAGGAFDARSFTIREVPEPGTLALFSISLGMLIWRRKVLRA